MDAENPGSPDLHAPALYLNRELSQLEFNFRVLAQARDPSVPLLERLRYLCISCTNLDEFFEIRAATVRTALQFGGPLPPDGIPPARALELIHDKAAELVSQQYQYWNDTLRPELNAAGIRILAHSTWNARQKRWLHKYFRDELLPVLSPLGLDPVHPFPRILNKSLNVVVVLEGKDAFGRKGGMAIVRAPRSLPRIIHLPPEVSGGKHDFVLLSAVLTAFVDDLFTGMKVKGAYQFRVTRNSELFVDEEEVENLASALKDELASRGFRPAVRLEIAEHCPKPIVRTLLQNFGLTENAVYRINGPVNLNRVTQVYDLVDRPDLKFPAFKPGPVAIDAEAPFDTLRQRDVLLHHPYQSFQSVLDLLAHAAHDPDVLAIKQTLYRTGKDSKIIEHLIAAARNGKDVTVCVELRARFDEEANIRLADQLQEAGVQVMYGVVGYKTHAKMMLIVRREGKKLQRYVHLGTGNYHAGTARAYTDIGLMTADPDITADVHDVFQQLSGLAPAIKLRKLMQSPFTLHQGILRRIEREAKNARAGKKGHIIAKMNALNEPTVIRALYEASQAGVRIELIVRGACCLRPGVPGVSDNISVRSVVGRFLEHSRVYWFRNGGKPELFCSSADWMERNLLRRVETCFPIIDEKLAERVFDEELGNYLSDNLQAWTLHEDGSYTRVSPAEGEMPYSAQGALLAKLCD
ncbi:MAG: RNA degradosome polyphosphate kinase [Arenimonas sp. SCN 70-307]|uniref:polyphosphate kinase 1 n=1 Tax=Arenimonas sp. SCN 70-307 TaxID=1660089 RepID=UPI00086C2832|nr:polyphosphate kinase 1 [Arenimonas sp. SCN 70-307]ODS64759.1 MAG: RNA degradosome polyphosphate kinase [Arenimonas sp. SCN 70-307]